jgi:hypothetical protein
MTHPLAKKLDCSVILAAAENDLRSRRPTTKHSNRIDTAPQYPAEKIITVKKITR